MLDNVELFEKLPSDAIESLAQHAVKRNYPKNAILFMEGDSNDSLYIVESGKVKVFVTGDDGRQVTLNFEGPGDYFGELALIDGEKRSASVMAVTACVIIIISRANFRDFLASYPTVNLDLMQALVKHIRELTKSVRDLALLDVYGRVARLLEKLASEGDTTTAPKLTHQEIANMIGASREMVSRIMKELTIGGYIEPVQNGFIINKRLPAGW